MAALGLDRVPAYYFEGKNGRNYRFHIFEDVFKADRSRPPRVYTDDDYDTIIGLAKDAPEVALYVHVPWCIEECTYCYYWGKMEKREAMATLLAGERRHAEMMDKAINLREKVIPSIYYGGGTPTVLPADLLEAQLSFFVKGYRLAPDAEVCVEASVGTLNQERINVLSRYATRLSIGIQSFSDRLLSMVARTFSRAKAIRALQQTIPLFRSVNIDLIYGMQSQTFDDWLETVRIAIDLGVPSVTLYRLEVRDGPPLLETFSKEAGSFPDEITCRLMHHEAKQLLERAGYRENLVGWFLRDTVADTRVYRERWQRQTPCVAFGPGVQNYGRDYIYLTTDDHAEYLSQVEQGRLPVHALYQASDQQQLMIWVMAQWKSNRPVDMAVLTQRFEPASIARFEREIQRFVSWGLIATSGGELTLTEGGKSMLEWTLGDLIRGCFDEPRPDRDAPARVSLPVLG